jgi:hypothetical protein
MIHNYGVYDQHPNPSLSSHPLLTVFTSDDQSKPMFVIHMPMLTQADRATTEEAEACIMALRAARVTVAESLGQ